MENVSFDGDSLRGGSSSVPAQKSNLVVWLVAHSGGIIRTEIQAVATLVVIAVVSLVGSFLLLYQKPLRLSPAEERAFEGKSETEKLLVPQMIDTQLFK